MQQLLTSQIPHAIGNAVTVRIGAETEIVIVIGTGEIGIETAGTVIVTETGTEIGIGIETVIEIVIVIAGGTTTVTAALVVSVTTETIETMITIVEISKYWCSLFACHVNALK